MIRDHIPYVLYDLTLAIGSEVRLDPLLVKTLQRLLFHTGFPVGIVLLEQSCEGGQARGRLHAVVGDHVLLRLQKEFLELPAAVVLGPPGVLDEVTDLASIGGSRPYRHGLRLPIDGEGTILLLAEAPVPSIEAMTQVLQPVLRNLARAIRLCRDSEQLTQTLESDLARSRTLLQAVIDTVPVWTFWKGRDLKYLGCNPAFAAAVGRSSPADVIGKDDFDFAPRHAAEAYRADDCAVMESGQPKLAYEERMVTPAGEDLWLRTSKAPLRGADGEVMGVLGITEDITLRKATESALQASEARYRAAFDTTLDAVTITRLDNGTLLECNVGFVEGTGHARDDVVGRSPLAIGLWADPADRARLAQLLERDGQVGNMEARFVRKNGEIFWGLMSATLIEVEGIPCILSITRDISEMKAAREELERHHELLEQRIEQRTAQLAEAKAAAEAASAAKSIFLANMSHEIRTPLNVISGMAHLIRRGGLTAEQSERLDKLLAASQHLLRTLDAVLDLSKIEAGKFALESEPVRPDAIVENVVSMMRERADAKGLGLSASSGALPPGLLGDAARLQQALLNLAANAVKFTERGSVALSVVAVDEGVDHALVRFEVADTGAGIAAADLPRLFQAFEQADNSTTRVYGGTGLGLPITRRLAELMGGEAGATSIPGRGSTFWFTARLAKSPGGSLRAGTATQEIEPRLTERHAGRRVLVVEDEPVNREITTMMLAAAGLVVDGATDGLEAQRAADERTYDLVIMDMQMPNMDGLEATRQLRRRPGWAGVPIVAMTANAFAEDRERCLAAGMNDFMTKPVSPDVLYRTVARWLDGSPR